MLCHPLWSPQPRGYPWRLNTGDRVCSKNRLFRVGENKFTSQSAKKNAFCMNQLYDSDITGASCHCKTTDVLFFQSLHRQFSPRASCVASGEGLCHLGMHDFWHGSKILVLFSWFEEGFSMQPFSLRQWGNKWASAKAWSWPIVRSLTRQSCKENYHCLRSFCSIDCTHFQVSKYLLPSIHPATITVQAET